MKPRPEQLRQTSLLLAIAISGQLSETSMAQTPEQTITTDAATAADDDEPPPSMALLEFVALFETEDGQWMDPEAIPLNLEPAAAAPKTADGMTPAEEPDQTDLKPDPPAYRDQRHAM